MRQLRTSTKQTCLEFLKNKNVLMKGLPLKNRNCFYAIPRIKKNEESDASFPPAAPLEKPSTQQRRPTHSTKAKCAAAAAASAKSRFLCGILVYFFLLVDASVLFPPGEPKCARRGHRTAAYKSRRPWP